MDKGNNNQIPGGEESFPTASLSDLSAAIGNQIGPYKLLSVLGEGGFGIVYLAEQKHPISRQVALKIIKPGMDSKRVVARFEAERQALALLDHPNIAHIFEAGSTEQGRPYFVMEYINGMPITEYCDHYQLKIEERLRLFIQVCQAVQHAHQKGIIHRDIKPSNIIVNNQDGVAVPRVIDFGVAKALGMPLTDKTIFTQQGQLIGTPEYMSPEQADQREKDIDTRTDIYSLGIVLYELLAGTLPFESKTLREAGYAAIGRIIKEQEPPRPSTKLSGLGRDAAKVAQNRHTEVSILVSSLHRELEWIPLMAIRKERQLRYQTASELAEDIQNYIEGNPLKAGPESFRYKLRKYIRKYKVPVAAMGAIAALIIVSLFIITGMYLRSEKLKSEIEKQLYNKNVALADTSKVNNVKYARQLLDACPKKLRGWEWEWLNSNLDQSILTLRGHKDTVTSVSFSPDGKRIASGSEDGEIIIWGADTGNQLLTLSGHQGEVYVCFSPDGGKIASGSADKTIKIWDAQSGQVMQTLKGHTDKINLVRFSPDGKQIASGGYDKTIRIWDVQSGQVMHTLEGHQGFVYPVCFSPDGKKIASGSSDKKIIVWDPNTGEQLLILRGHEGEVDSIQFSPDGKWIVSGSADKTIKIWDADTGREIRTLRGHRSFVFSVCFSADGKQIVSGSTDTTIKFWDVLSGDVIRTLNGHQGIVNDVCFSPDGKWIASGGDNTIKIWEADSRCRPITLNNLQTFNIPACFSPDGKWIASGTADKTIELYDVETSRKIRTFNSSQDEIFHLCFSPDGKRIVSASRDKTIVILDSQNGNVIRPLEDHTTDIVGAVCFSPDGRLITSIGIERIKLWDADNGRLLWSQSGDNFLTPCFSPDGRQIAAGTDVYYKIKIWDTRTGHEIRTFSGHQGWAYVVLFSPDGKMLVSGSMDNTIKIWDTENGRLIRTLNGHQGAVYAVCFSPDGKRIVSGSADNTVKMWDIDSGTPLLTLSEHNDSVALVFFSPDGKRIVSLSKDGIIQIWDIDRQDMKKQKP